MATNWLTTMKPSFTTDWLKLPPKELHQVLEKIKLLEQDPHPDAKVKKQLKYLDGKLHRIRSGDYRIFYTFDQKYVSLLALKKRAEDTYDEDYDVEFLGGLDVELGGDTPKTQPDWEKFFATHEPEKTKLPEAITPELLNMLRIPPECHARLIQLTTRDALYDCPGIPDEYLLKLDEYMFERPLVQVTQQPDYLLGEVEDLLRFKEGELVSFLLKLSPDQEKYVNWALEASGPTLVKGGPGTGKSTIALYRIRSLLKALKSQGVTAPRILFTTYTNALVTSSRQLLEQLLGEDAKLVEVQTADSLVWSILQKAGKQHHPVADEELKALLRRAKVRAKSHLEGNAIQKTSQELALDRMSENYLLEEICTLLVGRQLETLEEYLKAARPGRRMSLNANQRKGVWQVHLALLELLKEAQKTTFSHARSDAQKMLATSSVRETYDAVVVDEAQDLEPSVLRILVSLCKSPNRFFVTADANQSIYGSGFSWQDVHTDLRFQGRTGVLRTNYRSTREIGEAAHSYLSNGSLEAEEAQREYINTGLPPGARSVEDTEEEAQLLALFLPKAAREARMSLGACAVLCPTENSGRSVAARLRQLGVEATFMPGKELNLSRREVKVITLKSSKGLEFPVVALAGFQDTAYPNQPPNIKEDEKAEYLSVERRTMYVAMTRAMRTLLILIPAQTTSPLLSGFDPTKWNLGTNQEGVKA
ncbi:UvrD-helicase domain-containing protein [Candidatus Chlorohelix allophototropha]|uniref:DNA 3'-5' helicase n=2 Tax=Candidatus Chlorohelix allophototropha TaxID=3003348 RepID=A0ABY9B3V0_9CHLR|nr:UvrD-helicase domain-containing protein [Chloroflexota bacterium L227-S17]